MFNILIAGLEPYLKHILTDEELYNIGGKFDQCTAIVHSFSLITLDLYGKQIQCFPYVSKKEGKSSAMFKITQMQHIEDTHNYYENQKFTITLENV